MDKLLWLSSGLVMLALLLWLALRAFDELLGIRLRLSGAGYEAASRLSPARWPAPVVFIVSLAILWFGALFSYRLLNGEFGLQGFWQQFMSRYAGEGDAPRYIFMAENGYVREGEYVNNIVFYPLYPLLMAGLSAILGGRTALAGMIISQICYGLAAVVLMKLAKKDCAHPGFVILSFWLYPFGFFCLGVFTEGLFLLLSILCLYFLRRRKWLLAGLAALLCTLTRTQGILLLLPGVYEAWLHIRKKGWKPRCLAVLSPVIGYFIYLCINKAICGDFFAYQYYESIEPWWQTPQWLGATIAQQLDMAIGNPGIAQWIYWPQLFLYFIAAALLFAGLRHKLKTSYLLYGTAYLGMCYTASWLISGGRYMLGCIPLYFCIGQIPARGRRIGILCIEFLFFLLFGYWFMQGQCIM